MKRNGRLVAITKTLLDNPNKIFPLSFFGERFDSAKSSISEDIGIIDRIFKEDGRGYVETLAGIHGGVRFVPSISEERASQVQDALAEKIADPSRILGGGFLYTSDIMYDTNLMQDVADIFVRKFRNFEADLVATVETKGIPLASMVAHKLSLPLVIIRREAKVSEGSTVSINYFSGSYDRIQRMSLSKRAVKPGTKAIIIDDFMRGGGSVKGIKEILEEFDVEAVAVGVAITSLKPEKKTISNYTSILGLGEVDEIQRSIQVFKNNLKF